MPGPGKNRDVLEEVVVTGTEDAPSQQSDSVRSWEAAIRGNSNYGPTRYDRDGRIILDPLTPEQIEQLEEDLRYWDFIEDSNIPKEMVEDLIDKGYTPRQIYRLWIDRTPVTAPRAVDLGPDIVDLSPNLLPPTAQQPDAEFSPNPPDPDPDANAAAKFVVTRAIIKLFPKPLQWLAEGGLWINDAWQVMPQDQRQAINDALKDAFQTVYESMELGLMDDLWNWYTDKPTSGSETFTHEGITITAKETATRSIRDFEIAIPLDDLQITKPPKPEAVNPPEYLRPENWMPEEQPWPQEFPEELPTIKIEIEPTWIDQGQPRYNDLPYTAWKVGPRPVARTKIRMDMRAPPKTKPAEANRLRAKNEKKGRNFAAANVYRGLLKMFNKTYGNADEMRDLWEIFKDNAYIDNEGNVVINIEQLGYDVLLNELQDRAIGKVMGKYRQALEDNPGWHAMSAP